MERILEAMNNEERKTQEKINAQKVKGQRAKIWERLVIEVDSNSPF